MRRLPPLNALRVFEVAARIGSYAEAAAELGLTHGAVSRQISALERWMGQRLFMRSGRRMIATPVGRAFAAEVSLAFDRVTAAAEACGRPGARRIIRVSAPTSFAMRWLIPHLVRFHADHPDIEIALTTVSTMNEELRGGFDIAIRRGSARHNAWPQHSALHILDDVDTLIMSPALFAQRPIRQAADVADHLLLASETRAGDWTDWFDVAGLSHLVGHRRQVFDHFFVTYQAIVDGIGIGVGPLPMLAADVTAGRIVTPLPDITVRRTGYVALVPFDADKTSPLRTFIDWLVVTGNARG
jgi:LysR family transcriptional regulator, glycine cleavage system transcriptional activator